MLSTDLSCLDCFFAEGEDEDLLGDHASFINPPSAAAIQTQTSFLSQLFISPLLEGVHSIAAFQVRAGACGSLTPPLFHHPFATNSVMPDTSQGFSAEKCHFPIPRMMGWTLTSLAIGRDKAGSSGHPEFFPLLTFARLLFGSPVCFVLLE